jgi:hypothetical protein
MVCLAKTPAAFEINNIASVVSAGPLIYENLALRQQLSVLKRRHPRPSRVVIAVRSPDIPSECRYPSPEQSEHSARQLSDRNHGYHFGKGQFLRAALANECCAAARVELWRSLTSASASVPLSPCSNSRLRVVRGTIVETDLRIIAIVMQRHTPQRDLPQRCRPGSSGLRYRG